MSYSKVLVEAIKENNKELLLSLIGEDMVNDVSAYGPLPINLAIKFNNLDAIKLILEKGGSVSLIDSDGLSPIENAAWHNNKEIVRFLMEQGADALQSQNALLISTAKGNTDASAELIKCGVEVSAGVINALLYIAALRGETDNVKTFYLSGARLNYRKDGVNALTACMRNKHSDTVSALINLGGEDVGFESSLQEVDKDEWFSYVYNNEVDMVRHAIAKAGIRLLNYKNPEGETAIEIACFNNDVEMFKALFQLEPENNKKELLLNIVNENTHKDIVSLLN